MVCTSPSVGTSAFTNVRAFEWLCLWAVSLQTLAVAALHPSQFPGSSSSSRGPLSHLLHYLSLLGTLFPTDQGSMELAWGAACAFVVLLLLQLLLAARLHGTQSTDTLSDSGGGSSSPFLFDFVCSASSPALQGGAAAPSVAGGVGGRPGASRGLKADARSLSVPCGDGADTFFLGLWVAYRGEGASKKKLEERAREREREGGGEREGGR